MDRPGLTDAERLALETDWLHRLALRLVHDVHAAEDVVQDTLLAALDRPQWARQGDVSLRAWLTGTVRNLARLGQRGARVAVLSDQEWPAGYHAVAGRADGVPSGLYLVQLRVGSFVRTQKILLVR